MTIRLETECVTAMVIPAGGIVWRPRFKLPQAGWVEPFAVAPWAASGADDPDVPAYLRMLGGAFLAAPFGGRAVPGGAGDWPSTPGDDEFHGAAGRRTWRVVDRSAGAVLLRLDLAAPHPLKRLEQRIEASNDQAALSVEITITARRPYELPIGYHPTLRLPEAPHDLVLEAAFDRGHTYPFLLSDFARTAVGATFDRLDAVPARGGGRRPLDRLPDGAPGEDVLMLTNVGGPIIAHYRDKAYRVVLDWDRDQLPNCNLWVHDRAHDAAPWRRSFRGVAIEPSATAFDLAHAVSGGDNPLRRQGVRTAIPLEPGVPFVCKIDIRVENAA
jgi:hypothetical protein